jgi:UPF0271 protein
MQIDLNAVLDEGFGPCSMGDDTSLRPLVTSAKKARGNHAAAPGFSDIFTDRGYLASGQLAPCGQKGALTHARETATQRLMSVLENGLMPVTNGSPIKLDAHSICIHDDTHDTATMAHQIRARLTANGEHIAPFMTH